MENIEETLGAIMNNPQMMQQILSLAQSLGKSNPTQNPPPDQKAPGSPDFANMAKLSALAGSAGIDKDQKQLLQALTPYLSTDRVSKLENAMRAAKLARLASAFLAGGGLQLLSGR